MAPRSRAGSSASACIITLVGGTMFLMWLGEQITSRGIGNGISLIIFVGIVAELPAALAQFLTQGRTGALSPVVIIGIMLMMRGGDRLRGLHGAGARARSTSSTPSARSG